MKVLIVGDWHSDLHETELCKSLIRLGQVPFEFKWFHYFHSIIILLMIDGSQTNRQKKRRPKSPNVIVGWGLIDVAPAFTRQ